MNYYLVIKRNKLLIAYSNIDITWNNYMKLCERRERDTGREREKEKDKKRLRDGA